VDENTGRNTGNGNLKPPWPKGKCPNPKGRGRGNISLTSLIKRTLKEVCEADPNKRTWAEAFSRSLIGNAIKGNGIAIKEILNRVDGVIDPQGTNVNIDLSKLGDQIDKAYREATGNGSAVEEDSDGAGEISD
jgi:hypothetical protein